MAEDFAVWRAATRLRWRTTRADLSCATGLDVVTVREVIARRGWVGRFGPRVPLAMQAAPEVEEPDPFTAELTAVIC